MTQTMRGFAGFPAGRSGMIPVPTLFFSDLLPLIDNLAELKLTVYCFWALQQREGDYRYVRSRDLLDDQVLLSGFDPDPAMAQRLLNDALQRTLARGTLLHILIPGSPPEDLYFMNTDRGRRAVTALERGSWSPGDLHQPVGLIVERPNIFALYEQNIGPLTPMLGDMLRDAENTYPADWIADAMGIALESNKRSWRYIEAILKRWVTEGRPAKPEPINNADQSNPYRRDPYFQRDDEILEDE